MNLLKNLLCKIQTNIPTWMWTLLKGLVSAGLVIWLVLGFDWSKVYSIVTGISPWVIAGWLLILFLAYCLMALRLRVILSAQNIHISYYYAIRLIFIGAFAGNFLPSSMGGDTAKFIIFARAGYSKSLTGASIILDRFLNVLASSLFLPFALLVPGIINLDLQTIHNLPFWMGSIVAFVGVLVASVVIGGRRLIKSQPPSPADKSLKSLLHRMAYRLAEISTQWINYPWSLVTAMGLSFLSALLYFLDGWFLARGMKIEISPISWFAIQACLSVLVLLPISLNGLGLQEVSLVYLTSLVGIPEEKSLALALLLRILTVLLSLFGAFGLMAEKRKIPKADGLESEQ